MLAQELFEETNPGEAADLGIGPTFDELLDVTMEYLNNRVTATSPAIPCDVGIYYWRRQALDTLENAVRNSGVSGVEPVPILGTPDYLDSANLRRFQWTGVRGTGKKCHTNIVPCHTDLERQFADFLDGAKDVVRYFKNERFGFSVTYYENNRPRQYSPDFIVAVREADGREVMSLAETKGEIRPNTFLKRHAAEAWCEKMSATQYGPWRHLFVQQRKFEAALASSIATFAKLVAALAVRPEPQLRLVAIDDQRIKKEKFKSLLPLYTLKAAAGYFGNGEAVEPEAWIEVDGLGHLDDQMFVARAVGRSMEPRIHDGDYCVFRAEPVGTRHGKIVLAQYRGPADPDTGGSYTIKRYSSEKTADPDGSWRHARIVLAPVNPEFQPIILTPTAEKDIQIVAELIALLGRT